MLGTLENGKLTTVLAAPEDCSVVCRYDVDETKSICSVNGRSTKFRLIRF